MLVDAAAVGHDVDAAAVGHDVDAAAVGHDVDAYLVYCYIPNHNITKNRQRRFLQQFCHLRRHYQYHPPLIVSSLLQNHDYDDNDDDDDDDNDDHDDDDDDNDDHDDDDDVDDDNDINHRYMISCHASVFFHHAAKWPVEFNKLFAPHAVFMLLCVAGYVCYSR